MCLLGSIWNPVCAKPSSVSILDRYIHGADITVTSSVCVRGCGVSFAVPLTSVLLLTMNGTVYVCMRCFIFGCYLSMFVCAGDSEDELDDVEPNLETVMVQHPATVNRIRVSSTLFLIVKCL